MTFRTGETEPYRKDRLMALGNAVDVGVIEWLGRRIMAVENPIT